MLGLRSNVRRFGNTKRYCSTVKLYVIAGESSGDLIGAKLLRGINDISANKVVDCKITGVGGTSMQSLGLKSLFPISDLSVMGFTEVIFRLFTIQKRFNEVMQDINQFKPDAVVTIDNKGFNFRILKKLRESNTKALHFHFVGQNSVWGTKGDKTESLNKLSEYIDHMFLLFPFEKKFYEKSKLNVTYIGNPVVEEPLGVDTPSIVNQRVFEMSGNDLYGGKAFRSKCNIDPNANVICVLPGSREFLVKKLLSKVLKPALAQIKEKTKSPIHLVIPCVPHLYRQVEDEVKNWNIPFTLVNNDNQNEAEKYAAFAACDLAITISGSVVLELGVVGVPSIVLYNTNKITEWIIKRIASVKYASIPNIMENKEIIPELLFGQCNPANVATKAINYLENINLRKEQTIAVNKVLQQLTNEHNLAPSKLAASIIFDHLNNKQKSQ